MYMYIYIYIYIYIYTVYMPLYRVHNMDCILYIVKAYTCTCSRRIKLVENKTCPCKVVCSE